MDGKRDTGIHYSLDAGEYELRVYGSNPACQTCAIHITVDEHGILTIHPGDKHTIDIKKVQHA